jgi:Ca-activated chloride channel family protein
MHIEADRALIPAHEPVTRYLRIVINAPAGRAVTAASRPPAEVALVLDRSGSMDGTKIVMARKAIDHAVRLLKPQDHLAVVCYDDRVDTVLARTLATKEACALALDRLKEIDARGSTDLHAGWIKGADELRGAVGPQTAGPDANVVRRVLLLTDGLANQGVIDHAELAAAAARLRGAGVTTSTFGIGADFDEELLASLAVDGGGHFYFIERARQIPDFFTSELGEALEIVARDAVLEITCAPGVEAALVNNLPVQQTEGHLRVRLGDLVADQEVTVTVAVSFKPEALGPGAAVACRLSDSGHVLFSGAMTMDWRIVDRAENDEQAVNRAVVLEAAAQLAARARALALKANRRGDFEAARGILKDAIATLRALAPDDEQVEPHIARLQADEADFGEAMSPMAMKSRHFATHAVAYSREPSGKARRRR